MLFSLEKGVKYMTIEKIRWNFWIDLILKKNSQTTYKEFKICILTSKTRTDKIFAYFAVRRTML